MSEPTKKYIASENISVAKVSMWQAVLVALITACGGFLTAYLARPQSQETQVKPYPREEKIQHWIRIDRVEMTNGRKGDPDKFRVNIEVNSYGISFPTNSVWASIGPETNSEKFSLPNTTDVYRVKFSAIGRIDDNGTPFPEEYVAYENREVMEVNVNQLPLSNQSISLRPNTPFANDIVAPRVVVYYSLH